MGVWKVKILSSKRGETGVFEADLAKHLNLGWDLEGYSVDEKLYHFALLVKETKEDKD